MKILAITHVFPWPADNGARIRAANIVQALSRAGEVDLFTILSTHEARELGYQAEWGKPAREAAIRVGAATRPSSSYGIRRRLRWMAASSLPYEVGTRDYSAVRTAFITWAEPPYDLIWMEHAESFVALERLIDAPCIVDLDDLEDHKIRARLAARRHDWSRRDWWRRLEPTALAKQWGSMMQARLDVLRWQRLQQRIASSVDTVTVCSSLDRARLGVRNAAVVANGYQATSFPLGRTEVGQPPTLLLAGTLSYTPNADAAHYLVTDILPRIRERVPTAQVRLAGRYDGRAEGLRGEDVTLTGYVRDIGAELAQADVVVAPIRFGGGTRIKVLEAFAHRIPVVSTSLGCEGLEVIDGRHVLVSDDPDGFAAHCVRLLTDRRLREGLVAAASELFLERYRWESISSTVCEVARRAATADRRHSPIRPYGGASPNHSASSGRISASEGADPSR
jgi:glycosyltransferase involved in cell wall biosynthesis